MPQHDEVGELSPVLGHTESARTATGPTFRLAALGLLAALVVGTAAFPTILPAASVTVLAFIYMASTTDRLLLLIRGLRQPNLLVVDDAVARAVPDAELPVYTVLLPVYDEPAIVQNLLAGVAKLEYPHDRLEIVLLLEEGDDATAAALDDLPPELLAGLRVVTVPHSLPKTKPKACNYGMSLPDLRGEMLTVYDAEDVPEPLQLRRAVAAFRSAGDDLGCIQCRLAYFNETQNLLTRWFAMEYDQWFSVVLPAVEGLNGVLPLGGTSFHLPVRIWREVGGWDPYNVTEDADLGLRLARHGYRTVILDSVTLEEANSDILNWIRQRSRWYKGYLQTMLVHLRNPAQLRREVGIKAMLRFINLTGAVPLLAIVNMIFWMVMLAWVAGRPAFVGYLFPALPYYMCLFLFLVGTPAAIYSSLIVTTALGKPYLWWAAMLSPPYWILQSIAAIKAAFQLLFRPFYWEKTVHGLARRPDQRKGSQP